MLKGFLQKWMPAYAARPYTLGHDGLLHVLEGRRGRGKSYTATTIVLRAAEQRIPVLTNTSSTDFYRMAVELCRRKAFDSLPQALEWLNTNVTLLTDWNNLLEAYDCIIIIDEATRLFDARRGLGVSVPPVVYEWFRQSRKVKVTCYLLAQSLEWLDARVKQLLDLYWQVRVVRHKKLKAPDGMGWPLQFWCYGQDPGGVGRVEHLNRQKADFIAKIPFDMRVKNLYYSWELIAEVTGTPRYESMQDIRRFHEAHGRFFGLDAKEKLQEQIERLTHSHPDQATARVWV
jgi:hypothetical protein